MKSQWCAWSGSLEAFKGHPATIDSPTESAKVATASAWAQPAMSGPWGCCTKVSCAESLRFGCPVTSEAPATTATANTLQA